MAFDYGYGKLENELIALFHSGPPDFAAAEALIRQGADVNAIGEDDSENVLSEILSLYERAAYYDHICDYRNCNELNCEDCEHYVDWGSTPGEAMCAIIRFFLNHGFDVTKQEGCFGAQCLDAVGVSTNDRYMIDATKILLDAGAINRTLSLSPDGCNETPMEFMAAEACFYEDLSLGNIYEAMYQIYLAIENGKPYRGIDSYEIAIGKRVQKVLAASDGIKSIFYPLNLPKFRKDNCYTANLYFVYDGGVLITTQYADFWTDTVLPDTKMVDVSEHFAGIVGHTIRGFQYRLKTVNKGITQFCQPITIIETDSGCKVKFSTNFGDVEEDERAAFFELL